MRFVLFIWRGSLVSSVGLLLLLSTMLITAPGPGPVSAHGKELAITVDSLVLDAEQPLHVLYRVVVVYANDNEPVEDATVVMTATRGEGEAGFEPLALTPLAGTSGLYAGEVVFERFGSWDMHLDVEATLGLGEGGVDFVDEILPESVDPSLEAARRAEAERVASLQLLFGFEWWPDVITVLLRVVHSVAGLAYFIAIGLVFVFAWFGLPAGQPGLLARLSRLFLPVAGLSLAALLVAGMYAAAFDAPVTWPGLYDLDAMLSIPYGDAYLTAFLLKVVAFVLLLLMTRRINGTLRLWAVAARPEQDAGTVARLRRQSLIVAGIGMFVVVDVAVVIYLHYISHLAVFV